MHITILALYQTKVILVNIFIVTYQINYVQQGTYKTKLNKVLEGEWEEEGESGRARRRRRESGSKERESKC